ncbi:paladin-like, partial [Gracilinanus agilis]|uniref:paladin-like n=1 Tax=Gracilinanus agilis TaxID=191870 RepID=UPI001CFD3F80
MRGRNRAGSPLAGLLLDTFCLWPCFFSSPHPSRAAPLQSDPRPPEPLEVVQSFIRMVPEGRQIVEEVDHTLAACSEMYNLKETILENQKKLEGLSRDHLQ